MCNKAKRKTFLTLRLEKSKEELQIFDQTIWQNFMINFTSIDHKKYEIFALGGENVCKVRGARARFATILYNKWWEWKTFFHPTFFLMKNAVEFETLNK